MKKSGAVKAVNPNSHLEKLSGEIDALKKTNMFLSSLYDGLGEEIIVIDQDFNIIDANRAFLKNAGLVKEDVAGKRCYEIKRASHSCLAAEGRCPVEMASTGEPVEMTVNHKGENEDLREYIVIMYPLKAEGESRRYFLEITRDVTEYRHLILKLQRSEKRFKTILDTATDAIISTDENLRIILFNNAAQKIFGYAGNEVIGKNLDTIIPQSSLPYQIYLDRLIENQEPDAPGKTISLNAMRKNGELFPAELSVSVMNMGKKKTFTAIIRDATHQHQMERKILQAERLASVGQAVARVAHEIKNPLMIIGGFTSQIRSVLENEKDINKIDMVLDEVTRLERLIANLGDFTKEYKLVMRPAEIKSVIGDVLNIMTGVYSDNKYRFEQYHADGLCEITCDPDKLKQVFINIISNGVEAMPEGGVIRVKTLKIKGGVEISIGDDGKGMSGEELKHIFEPFYTTREKGTGLGLAISYKIVQAHNGDIWAVSSPGQGTTFTIQIPG